MVCPLKVECRSCGTVYATKPEVLRHEDNRHVFFCYHGINHQPKQLHSFGALRAHLESSHCHAEIKESPIRTRATEAPLEKPAMNVEMKVSAVDGMAVKLEVESTLESNGASLLRPDPSAVPNKTVMDQPHDAAAELVTASISWTSIPESKHYFALRDLTKHVHTKAKLREFDYWTKGSNSTRPPEPSSTSPKRPAIVVDCEMVGTSANMMELIRLSAIDYLMNEVLIDALVKPEKPITAMRTKYTGITRAGLAEAVANGKAFHGYGAARAELWKYMDQTTILVGQALFHDLRALRITHSRVVDSAILTSTALGSGKSHPGLQTLCKDLIGVPFRQGENAIHDSVEDCHATREVVLCCVENGTRFKNWVAIQKEILEKERAEREQQKLARRELKAQKNKERRALAQEQRQQAREAEAGLKDNINKGDELISPGEGERKRKREPEAEPPRKTRVSSTSTDQGRMDGNEELYPAQERSCIAL